LRKNEGDDSEGGRSKWSKRKRKRKRRRER
jgi:hypothetical protein